LCTRLALRSGAIVMAIDYRLAPEHPFPAAVDDAFAAYCWLRSHAADIDGDPTCVAVAGDSAGGNLSAVVAERRQFAPI
jgi:acetyl esterase/lipase